MSVSDPATISALMCMAEDYEARARELEARISLALPSSARAISAAGER